MFRSTGSLHHKNENISSSAADVPRKQSRVRRFYWHICYLLCQEPDEEMMTSFF